MKFGGIVQLCHPFSYPHPNFAGEKKEHEKVWLWEI